MDNTTVNPRKHRSSINTYAVEHFNVGGTNPLFLIAGPCIIEDLEICLDIIDVAVEVCSKYNMNYIFKASYDKANKTIADSYRGPGWKVGLEQLEKIKAKRDVPILTDVHEREQCQPVADVASVLQIPALLSKQIDLILAAAQTGKTINIKKGQFTPAWEANNVVSRLRENGYEKIMLTDRGYLFGYGTLINDMRALQIMSQFNAPVVYDASHSVHGNDTIVTGSSLIHRDFIRPLVRSAVANGIDGIFLEVHPDPDSALSDSIGTYPLDKIEILLKEVIEIDKSIIK
jgi:2-dehydro-3-deoxyphosphooctonate aldolase (KDO 8-P synthase)